MKLNLTNSNLDFDIQPAIIPCEYDVIGQNDTQNRLHGFKEKLIIFDLANKKKNLNSTPLEIIGQNDTQNPLHHRNQILTVFSLLCDTSISRIS